MPLQWSDPAPPDGGKTSFYDHVIAKTPLGDIRLEWESRKDHDSPSGEMPWQEFVIGWSLDEAKAKAQEAWDRMVPKLVELCVTCNLVSKQKE